MTFCSPSAQLDAVHCFWARWDSSQFWHLLDENLYLSLTEIQAWKSLLISEELLNMPKKGFEMKTETRVFKIRLNELATYRLFPV